MHWDKGFPRVTPTMRNREVMVRHGSMVRTVVRQQMWLHHVRLMMRLMVNLMVRKEVWLHMM